MKDLPLFSLSSIVMPGGRLPLRIFEPRYIAMVRGCLKQQVGFGLCLISEGSEVGAPAIMFPYGTLIEIVDWDRDESGLLMIVTQGVQKFRTINTYQNEDGLVLGEVELLPVEQKTAVPAEYADLAALLHNALDSIGPLLDYSEADFTDAVWVSGRLVELLPMSTSTRHDLLAIDDSIERLEVLKRIVEEQS